MRKLFFTVSLFFILFFILELVSYNFLYGYFNSKRILKNNPAYPQTRNDETLTFDNTKEPILTIGCSYTYGMGIQINKTFASQLQNMTGRKILNVAEWGTGSEFVLYSIAYLEQINELRKYRFKYVIYTVMYDHIQRFFDLGLLSDYISVILKQNKNNSLKDKTKYYLNKSYMFKIFYSKKYGKTMDYKRRFNYHKYNISKINEIIKRTLPDCQLVVLLYDDITNASKDFPYQGDEVTYIKIPLDKNNYEKLTAEGIKFISTKDLVGDILYKDEYQLPYDTFQYWRPHHPNEKAWEMIVPQLCKELNL